MNYNASVYNDNYTLLEQLEAIKSLLANINPEQITELSQQVARSLKTPLATPTSTKLVAVDTTNAQEMVSIGDGLAIENGKIEAVPYLHLKLLDSTGYNSSVFTTGWLDEPIYLDSDNNRDLVIRGTLDDTKNTILVETDSKATLYYTVSNDIGQTDEGDVTISSSSSYTLTLPIGTTAVSLQVGTY